MSLASNRRATQRSLLLFSPAAVTIFVLVALPLLIMGHISLLDRGINGGVDWTSHYSFDSYRNFLWEEDLDGQMVINIAYLKTFLRSVTQAGVTTVLCFLVGFPAALWMSSVERKWRDIVVLLITIPFWTNLLIRNYAWLIILREDGWLQQWLTAIWPGDTPPTLLYNDLAVAIGLTYSFLPFMILPIYATLEKFDWRLAEAAYDLGANRWRVLTRVILPISMPGIIGGAMLVFIPSLGAFVTPALLGGGKTLMIGNLIQLQFGPSRNWPFGGALSVILLALMMLVLVAYALHTNYRSRRDGRVRS